MDRSYYSQRTGKLPALNLAEFRQVFLTLFNQLKDNGYFQEYLGYVCVDRGFIPGLVGADLQAELLLTLRKSHLWPFNVTISNWSEDDLFDVAEFLYDRVSKPTDGHYHEYNDCGWHYNQFDRNLGREEYRKKLNRILEDYDSGFVFSESGEVLALGALGLESLLDAPIPRADAVNVGARVQGAIRKFRRHRSPLEDRRDAVRDLADVLEFLRPQLKQVLTSKDEQDLFNIANNFGIRHHKVDQKIEYDQPIWLSWLFYYYLATVHSVLRLLEKANSQAQSS